MYNLLEIQYKVFTYGSLLSKDTRILSNTLRKFQNVLYCFALSLKKQYYYFLVFEGCEAKIAVLFFYIKHFLYLNDIKI